VPQVLTTNAIILCLHGGKGTTTPTRPLWSVNGGFVLVENDPGVLACPFLIYPCIGYQLRSMGLNASQIQGQKVILVTDFNQSFTGLPLIMTETHTTIDNSTPAPIPAGQSAPPLSAALADVVAPVVTAAPMALAFNATTMLPPTLVTTFTLVSANPMQWILTLINEPLRSDVDLTNGLPPGLVVAPAGGAWNQSPLVVTVTMTALYMASLTPGTHHFYMTGVSQRGLSGYAEVVLTVS
jgi:hypothetical protein